MHILVLSIVIALTISAMCSLMEAVVLSLTPGQLDDLNQRQPKLGKIWNHFKTHIDQPIAVILVMNTAAHTVGATIAGAKFEEQFGTAGLVWFSLIFTYLMLQFTEILPKSIGVRFNRQIAPWIALPLQFLIRMLRPFLWFIHLVNRPFAKSSSNERASTLEEIAALAGLARLGGLLGEHQERIIRGASRLSHLKAAEVMIPLEEISFVSSDQTLMDAIINAHEDVHTRFPMCDGKDRDKILGYVNFKEMIYWSRTNPSNPTLKGIARPVHFTSPDTLAPDLLQIFVEQHEHLAIVRSADNKTLGLVTLEDLIEELVGELEDEFDRLPKMFHPISDRMWMVGGGVKLGDIEAKLGVTLGPKELAISKFLEVEFANKPDRGQMIEKNGLQFHVRRLRRGKVFEVAISRLNVV